ncbi:MAG: hypothetical protein ACRDOK_08800 [Streptosporangiaceae bacterium]
MPLNRVTGGSPRDAGLGPSLTPLARPGVVVIVCRWRYEIGLVVGAVAAITAAVSWIGALRALAGLAGLVVAAGFAATRPEVRGFAVARAWCVITPHRVRTCFAQAWIYNRAGRIPAVVRTTARPFGERVLVWCRAGTSFEDIDSACDLLAAACWASRVVSGRSSRFAHLVYLDVIRWPEETAEPSAEPGPAESEVSAQAWPNVGPDRWGTTSSHDQSSDAA